MSPEGGKARYTPAANGVHTVERFGISRLAVSVESLTERGCRTAVPKDASVPTLAFGSVSSALASRSRPRHPSNSRAQASLAFASDDNMLESGEFRLSPPAPGKRPERLRCIEVTAQDGAAVTFRGKPAQVVAVTSTVI